MLINGKEYGFFYDVEAYCEYEDFIIKNPEVGKATATIELAIIMNREYNKKNGIKDPVLKRSDIAQLPFYEYKELETTVNAQIKLDSERTVEAAPGKTKAAGKGN